MEKIRGRSYFGENGMSYSSVPANSVTFNMGYGLKKDDGQVCLNKIKVGAVEYDGKRD